VSESPRTGRPRSRVVSLIVALKPGSRVLAARSGRETVTGEGGFGGPLAISAPAPASAPTTPARASSARHDHTHRRRNGALLVALAVVLVGWLVVRPLVAEPFRIPSQSMAPTIEAGDHVLVNKLAYGGGLPHRGDLVVFRAPRTGEVMLKRVVALPGDRVAIEDGVLVVNGRHVQEPYTADPAALDSVYFGPVRVKADSVFVLGDNRGDSVDSREYGVVAKDRLIGRVAARLWPPTRWGTP
jgi:signal peptidase I